ncbi:MAG: hypothetical protein IJ060_00405 [Oscillospiraceae bacterium]|nr:hypothetical protein [Oscillospiraceae bacterium]
MEEHMPRNAFDIPAVFYFEVGNIHTGSRGALRYRILPKDGSLITEAWREDICYELAKERGVIEATESFPVSKEGFQQMLDFLQNLYDTCGYCPPPIQQSAGRQCRQPIQQSDD